MAEYFFELLLEEIPAWMHDAAQATLQQQLAQVFGSRAILNSTPRRLIVYLPNIPEREADRDEEVKGPPVKAAYDAGGKPTQALNGFLRKNNATIGTNGNRRVFGTGDSSLISIPSRRSAAPARPSLRLCWRA